MDSIIEFLQNLLGHSVPSILVIAGIAFLAYTYLIDAFAKKEIPEKKKRSATNWGIILLVIGLVLGVAIKPSAPEPQSQQQFGLVIYPEGNIPGSAVVNPTPIIATQEPEIVIQPTATDTPIPTETINNSTPEIVEQPPATGTPLPPPTSTPIPPPPPTFTPTPPPPQRVTNVISVSSKEENGVRVNIDTTGLYEITYWGDAYSPWPNDQSEGYRGWTNILRIYVNRPVEWGTTSYGLTGPINEDFYLGPGNYYLDKNQAIATARGDSRQIRLNAGDYLTLVTLDEKGRYGDNRDKLDIGISYLGP